jgi:hypothetical protein
MKRVLLICVLASSVIAFAQDLRPMSHGDHVTGVGLIHGQTAHGPVTFTQTGEEFTFRAEIDATGRRAYFRGTDVSPYWIYDREFTRLTFRGMDMAPDERFTMLPSGGEVAAGQAWDVAPHYLTIPSCGRPEIRYKAVAEQGPLVPLRLDARDENVATVRIHYAATVKCPNGREPFLRTHELIYSPQLREIVQSVSTNYDGPAIGRMQLGTQTRGWRLRGVDRAK